MPELLDYIHCKITINVCIKLNDIAFFSEIIYNIKKFVERRGKTKMNQSDFLNYMSNFIDIEEIEAICILLFSLAIGFVIFQVVSFYGCQYEKNFESAIQKQKKGQELTKKESRILSDFDRYKNNF